ncbi:MAG: hypothetical protein EAZ81_08595 [Verrucomicrobia bacterium]|nr:MAG: hypothetical protein EAZ81_08595 [Verrucomicrobiota bacterium]
MPVFAAELGNGKSFSTSRHRACPSHRRKPKSPTKGLAELYSKIFPEPKPESPPFGEIFGKKKASKAHFS